MIHAARCVSFTYYFFLFLPSIYARDLKVRHVIYRLARWKSPRECRRVLRLDGSLILNQNSRPLIGSPLWRFSIYARVHIYAQHENNGPQFLFYLFDLLAL
jgi:hypothetical protein